ncbi:hypothetical protein GCM10023194_36170 [Planotetraspora phitsanulokensis]|uniref:Uncharacterized protein n=1 Tax=Planotetraspora phitsanulokensis TaxID=575192 RepID=A0A8J3UBZ2_9ACTN|nr:hypothetical protein [Planotetraspora phitsanulokensis]GII36255.1 hypothetical protein Pph01_12580 [Planotetraspora phitsanulokensis]
MSSERFGQAPREPLARPGQALARAVAPRPSPAPESFERLQRLAGNAAVQRLASWPAGLTRLPVQLAPPTKGTDTSKSPSDTLAEQVTEGRFKEALEYLNGLPMEYLLVQLDKLGFANANYLLTNLSAAAWLGPFALARLEAAIRSVGIRQTGTVSDLLIPLINAVSRSGVRQYSDQFSAIRAKVRAPAGGWTSLIQGYFAMADLAPIAALTATDNVFRVLDFVTDVELNQALRDMQEPQLRLLIVNSRGADRVFDGERIKRALDATWRGRFPKTEPPWPKAVTAEGLNVATMSSVDKLGTAIRWSERHGGEELAGKLEELLSLKSLAFIAGTTILFAVLEMGTGGAAGAVMLVVSAAMVGPEVYTIASDIQSFITTALGAKDETDLDLAARYFAKAAVAIGVDILTAILLHKPTKMVTPKIQAGARVAGEFLKARVASGGGGLVPALVMGEGPPSFVHAPPERLTTLETRGGPAPQLPKAPKALRNLAKNDDAAAWALLDRYWRMPRAQLSRLAKMQDETAIYVLQERIKPNDEALIKAQGSNYRPPHEAEVTITRPQYAKKIWEGKIQSGRMTDQEAALGWPDSMFATHTEARAVKHTQLKSGDVLTIFGQYNPCAACRAAMAEAAIRLGIRVHYHWMGGRESFYP